VIGLTAAVAAAGGYSTRSEVNVEASSEVTLEDALEALVSTDKCLRRLANTIRDQQQGGADEVAMDLWLKRSRRQLKVNRDLIDAAAPAARVTTGAKA
jgi:hypothetical protein